MRRVYLTAAAVVASLTSICRAADTPPFNPDTDPSRISWIEITKVLGPPPDVRGQRFGIIIKTLTNEYWRLMAAGYRKRAAADDVKLDIQAAQSESDPLRQLAMMENMIGSGHKALMISPISTSNLGSAIEDALSANVPVVDVDGAVVDNVRHFVGANNREMGFRVARWFIEHYPDGGQVAVIEGQAGVFSTVQRSAGFVETLEATRKFKVVDRLSGQWDAHLAYDAAMSIMNRYPELIGFYCNNDTMALGAVDAVKSLKRLDTVHVIGTDGTRAAYASIKAGELTGTVDIFPSLTGAIGLDVAERLSVGQAVPRVITTPEALVTRDTISRYEGSDESTLEAIREATLAGR